MTFRVALCTLLLRWTRRGSGASVVACVRCDTLSIIKRVFAQVVYRNTQHTLFRGLVIARVRMHMYAYHIVAGVAVLAFEYSRAMLNYRWTFRQKVVEVEWRSRVAALRIVH